MHLLIPRTTGGVVAQVGADIYREHLGMLISPRRRTSAREAVELGAVWAADNDCFTGLNRDSFIPFLRSIARFPNCRFVTAPDVVANAAATLARFKLWQPTIRYFKLPVALVAQDGLESLPLDWNSFDALFIGGSTKWKLSEAAATLALEAKQRGKWLHMGRVNSRQRIKYAESLRCDSVDGTGFAMFSRRDIPKALPMLNAPQLPLWNGLIA